MLWNGTIGRGGNWQLHSVHLTHQVCSGDLAKLAEVYTREGYQVVYAGPLTAGYRKVDKYGYLHCLPDTVDPRGGPKGK
jgi:hypothetical protein